VYKKFETQKARLNYVEAGSGRPVVILPGLGYKGTTYQELIDYLSREFLVIAPNLHFGIGNEAISEIDDYVQILSKFIEEKHLKDIIVVGHSFGGSVAIKLAQTNKNITGMVLSGSTGLPMPYSFGYLVYLLFLKTWNDRRYGKIPIIIRLIADFSEFTAGSIFQLYKAKKIVDKITKADLVSKYRAGVKTILIWGNKDEFFPVEYSRKLQKKLSDSKLEILPGNHDLPLFEEVKFGKIIVDYFGKF